MPYYKLELEYLPDAARISKSIKDCVAIARICRWESDNGTQPYRHAPPLSYSSLLPPPRYFRGRIEEGREPGICGAQWLPDDFRLPDLGEGLEEAELVEWCVHVGQQVQENDILAKMETAKALVDVPSPRGGIIAALHGQPGEAIKVGSPLVTYRDAGAAGDGVCGRPRCKRRKWQEHRSPAGRRARRCGISRRRASGSPGIGGDGKPLAAPAVRRLARDRGVNLEQITGSGIGGRITAADVEAVAKAKRRRPLKRLPRRRARRRARVARSGR